MKIILNRVLLILILLGSILQAVSVFSFTSESGFRIDLAPYWFIGIIAFLYLLILFLGKWKLVKNYKSLPKDLRIALGLIILFIIYSVMSAILFPRIFSGIEVLNPRIGIDGQYKNPSLLAWSFSNIGQAGYLIINFIVVLFLLYSNQNHNGIKLTYKIFLIISSIAILFGIFQHFSVYYFPNQIYEAIYSITHNNQVYFSYPSTTTRTNSLFLEPSVFSGFAAMYSMVVLSYFLYSGNKIALMPNIIGFYGVLISLSTTGIASYILNVVLTISLLGFLFIRLKNINYSFIKRFAIVLLFLASVFIFFQNEEALIASFPRRNPESSKPVTNLMGELETQTIEKTSTSSFTHRLWADKFSITSVLPNTYFLGAGLGSNRPSSFIAYILSNTGLFGFITFFGTLLFIFLFYFRHLKLLNPITFSLMAGFIAALIAMFGSLPDLNWPPTIWILAGLLIPSIMNDIKTNEQPFIGSSDNTNGKIN